MESNPESFFSLGAIQHLVCYMWLGWVFTGLLNWWLSILICFAIGFEVEVLQTTPLWNVIKGWIKEPGGLQVGISWKDIIVNTIGSFCGVIAYLMR